jgi:hypothetical protein
MDEQENKNTVPSRLEDGRRNPEWTKQNKQRRRLAGLPVNPKHNPEKRKEYYKNNSEYFKKYRKSPAAKAATKRYRNSEKGKATINRFLDKARPNRKKRDNPNETGDQYAKRVLEGLRQKLGKIEEYP